MIPVLLVCLVLLSCLGLSLLAIGVCRLVDRLWADRNGGW